MPDNVTQRDREAAAAWAKRNSRPQQAANILRGSCDTAPLVQAFASHRTADTARIAELEREVARLREALEAIKKADTRDIVKHGYCFYTDEEYSSITGQRVGPCAQIATTALGGQP